MLDKNLPVVVFAYNRPKTIKILLTQLKKIKPPNIIFFLDGPKNKKDNKKCRQVKLVITKKKWKCKKKIIVSKSNKGLKKSIIDGLNYVFKNYEKAIILEDDCIPNKSFFLFCSLMLKKFNGNKNISGISGSNFYPNKINTLYYFSKYSSIWGWATWKRVWHDTTISLSFWPKYKKSIEWKNKFTNLTERYFWENKFDEVYEKKINSWAYIYLLNNFYKNRITVVPKYNLVKNIGFGKNSTNTKLVNKFFLPKQKNLKISNKEPKNIIINEKADNIDFKNVYAGGRRNRFPFNLIFNIIIFISKIFQK